MNTYLNVLHPAPLCWFTSIVNGVFPGQRPFVHSGFVEIRPVVFSQTNQPTNKQTNKQTGSEAIKNNHCESLKACLVKFKRRGGLSPLQSQQQSLSLNNTSYISVTKHKTQIFLTNLSPVEPCVSNCWCPHAEEVIDKCFIVTDKKPICCSYVR